MEEDRIDIDEVKKYLFHQLSDEAKSSIDKRREEDPAFEKEFTLYKTMLIAMEEHYNDRLKDLLRKEDHKKPAKQRTLFITLSIAASVAIILVVSYLLFIYSAKPTSQQLFTEYYRPYYNVIDDHKRGNSIENNSIKAFRLYEQKEYKKAATIFENELKKKPDDPALLFYSGLSYLALNQAEPAKIKLKRVADENSTFGEAAEWYLALAHLKTNNIVKATEILKHIAAGDSGYRLKAEQLLEQI